MINLTHWTFSVKHVLIMAMLLTLRRKTFPTPHVGIYEFDRPADYNFTAGQFALLQIPGAPKKDARAFSIASSPAADQLTFVLKQVPNGVVSSFLAKLVPGEQVEVSAPLGRFTLDESDQIRIFLATGTGIAPIKSYLEVVRDREDSTPWQLLWGFTNAQNIFWQTEIPQAKITLAEPEKEWAGLRGRVTDHLPAIIASQPTATFYLCGHPEMIKDARALLLAAQIPAAKIRFEVY